MYYQPSHPIITIFHCSSLMATDHLHNEFELVYCLKGSFEVSIDSATHKVNEGQLSISFPNQSHRYFYDKSVPLDTYVLIFNIQLLPEIKKYLDSYLPANPIIDVSDNAFLKNILNKINENNGKDDFSVLKRSGYLKLLAAEIFKNMEFIPTRKTDHEILKEIVNYCNNHFTDDIHLSDLEEHLHISKYYISHIFKEKVKMGFNEYIHSLRIEAAEKLLTETDDAIYDIAYNVGYNTVRNFNRMFLKITETTPGKYRTSKAKK